MLKAVKKKITTPVIIGGISVVAFAVGLYFWFRKQRSQRNKPTKPQEKTPSKQQENRKEVEEQQQEQETSRIYEEEEEKFYVVRNVEKKRTTKLSERYQPPPELDDVALVSKKKPDRTEKKLRSSRDSDFMPTDSNSKHKSHRKTMSSSTFQTQLDEGSEDYTQTRMSLAKSPERTVMRSPQRGLTLHSTKRLIDEDEFEPYSDPEYGNKHPVSREYCIRRAQIVNAVSYEIALNLAAGSSYEGYVKITFNLNDIPEDLFIDAHVISINKIVINNYIQNPAELYARHAVLLPKSLLLNRMNVVQIYFKNDYSKDGSGLNSVLDANQLQYLWTQNAPANAQRVFPCFDQPSIRATFKLFALVPQQWTLISNEQPASVYRVSSNVYLKFGFSEDFNGFKMTWEFNETTPLSSYLFTVCAGPFEEIPCVNSYNQIKMSLFCRKGVKNLAKETAEHIFYVTNTAIQYFEEIFGCLYPFSKYDMIICPEFFGGSIQNPGTVIFTESSYLFTCPSDDEKLTLAYAALNELAHTWFGNLISMEWWDSHWLVESFAAFLAYHTLETIPELSKKYPDGWVRLLFQKDSAYSRDQLPTAQPLGISISNTNEAEIIFDEILHARGATCLRQLTQIIGFDNLCQALRIFCAKYAWKVADTEAFFNEINTVSLENKVRFDLEQWKRDWIYTPGLNVLEVQWEASKDGELNSLIIRQESCNEEFPILRKHFIRLGLFDCDGKSEFIVVKVENMLTTAVKLQRKAPVAILANYDDIGYVKVRIDEKSLNALSSFFNKIDNNLARALFWNAQLEMVHDRRLSCFAFIELLIKSIDKERHPIVLYNLLKSADSLMVTYLPSEQKNKKSSEVFQKLYQIVQIESWELNPNDIEVYLEMLVAFAREPSDVLILIKWLKNENADLGFRRPKSHEIWQILIKAAAKKVLREDQLHPLLKFTQDSSENDPMFKSTLDTVLLASSFERRQDLWAKFLKNPEAFTVPEWEYVFKGFNHEFLAPQYESYIEPFFNSLLKLYSQTSWGYFKTFYTELFPRYSEDFDFISSKIQEVLKTLSNNHSMEEGSERLIALLTESLEETKKRRYCFSLNTTHVESSQKTAFEFLLTSQNKSPTNELEHKTVMQNMLEHLKTDESALESPPDQEQKVQQEEERKSVVSKQWKKNEGDKFELSNSYFKDWVPSTNKLFQKMLAADSSKFSVLPKQFATNQEEYKGILELMEEKYYFKLVYIFLNMQADSNKYPQIGWQEISSALKNAKIFNKSLGVQDCEKMILQQLKASPKNAKSGFKETSLLRFEFVELIIRMALKKYSAESHKDKIERFLENDILPVFKSAEYIYDGYRYEKIHTVTMNNLLQHWIEQIKTRFSELKTTGSGYVMLKSLMSFLSAKKIQLIDADVIKCFVLSKMLVVDELPDQNFSVYFTMSFPEFLEFLIRIAGALDDTQDRLLTDKVQRVFPKLF